MKKQIERLNEEVQIADEKAMKLLSHLEDVMGNITNGYDSRFERLLKKVIEQGYQFGGYQQNWKEELRDLKIEMETELMSREDSNN
tara:strand:- start:182 stop:439 length:258 start_codon:yes stop_codon:yes gene_type:complete